MALRPTSLPPAARWAIAVAACVVLAAAVTVVRGQRMRAAEAAAVADDPHEHIGKVAAETVRVSLDQLPALNVGTAVQRDFADRRQTLGIIDFDQDRTVAVSVAYTGRVAKVLAKAGDDVRAGQVLYTVFVPDVAQAASTLISTSGTLRATTETLRRAQVLAKDDSIPQKEFQQNQADQQAADAAYRSARKSLQLFGLGDAEIARIERDRAVDVEMPVKSPIDGRVTARNVQPGLLVQPGAGSPPFTVADMRKLWMVASVPESEYPLYKVGQAVAVRVQAWPGRSFAGRIAYVGDTVDPATHRLSVRADITDIQHELRPQMLADFSITLSAPQAGVAVPATAVVRETNGRNVVWVEGTSDPQGQRFVRRHVVRGREDGDVVQISDGLRAGERIVQRNALFLSNLYETAAQ